MMTAVPSQHGIYTAVVAVNGSSAISYCPIYFPGFSDLDWFTVWLTIRSVMNTLGPSVSHNQIRHTVVCLVFIIMLKGKPSSKSSKERDRNQMMDVVLLATPIVVEGDAEISSTVVTLP